MKSQWLENYEKEMKALQSKSNSGKRVIYIIFPVIILFLIFAFLSADNLPPEALPSAAGVIGVLCLVFLMAILLSKKSAKKDIAKITRDNFTKLNLSEEQIMEFDKEMASPQYVMDAEGTSKVLFTQHYIVTKDYNMGVPEYRFARLCDIVSNDYAKASGAVYYVDLLDRNGNNIISTAIVGGQNMSVFENLLMQYCPGISLKKRGF